MLKCPARIVSKCKYLNTAIPSPKVAVPLPISKSYRRPHHEKTSLRTLRERDLHTASTGLCPTQGSWPVLEIPDPVHYVERTTPSMSRAEVQRYIYPLYCRGWNVESLKPNDGFNEDNHNSWFLVGKMTLKGQKSARKLLQELLKIEEQEKHDVSFNLWSGKRPILTVMTQTHSARLHPVGEDNATSPAITLRDVRVAVLLERFLENAKLGYPKSHEPPASAESAWEEFTSPRAWMS